jgi:hypothetical protein
MNVQYEGVFFGTLRESTVGTIEISDQQNQIHFKSKLGQVEKRSADYFSGVITKKNKPVAGVLGTYLGYLNVEGQRIWDGRHTKPFRLIPEKFPLPSDSSLRKDLRMLEKGRLAEAQYHRD